MQPARRADRVLAGAAVVLLFAGIVALLLWRTLRRDEALPYAADAAPPAAAQVTRDATYSLATPGGVTRLLALGVPVSASTQQLQLQCTWALGDSTPQPLAVTAETSSSKAENTFAHFTAPVTGPLRVACRPVGAVYVPDAENAPTDIAGAMVLVSVITLTAGAALGLSAAYRRFGPVYGVDGFGAGAPAEGAGSAGPASSAGSAGRARGDDDQVERLGEPVGGDVEVLDTDRGHVGR